MTITIYTDPNGTEHTCLPHTWGNTTNITEAWALAHGWSKTEREIPDPPPPPKQYSKLRLHRALDAAGIWDTIWHALTDAQRTYWQEAQELADDDPEFSAALAALRSAVSRGDIRLPSGVDIESILAEAEI